MLSIRKITPLFTCNHGTKDHCYGHEKSVRKQAPKVVLHCAAPPDHLEKRKRDGHAYQTAVFHN